MFDDFTLEDIFSEFDEFCSDRPYLTEEEEGDQEDQANSAPNSTYVSGIQMNYDNFHQLNNASRLIMAHVLGFLLWAIVVGFLLLVRIGQLSCESGKLFRLQFEQGYQMLDGSFCPLTCGISCELPHSPIGELITSL